MAKKPTGNQGPSARRLKKRAAGDAEPPTFNAEGHAPDPGASAFPIVGVGASAGGLEAFSEMLRVLPADPGMAFVFIQHLDPKHVSVLAQLLGRESQMQVVEARNGLRVERDHVYVIPRNTSLTLDGGTLVLGPREIVAGHFISIDTFLQSLARDRGSAAIGVLLSGTASDGSLGLKAIKAAGGITFAQDPQSAKFDGMPRAAINSGCVDFVRNPQEISKELMQLRDRIVPESIGDQKMLDSDEESTSRILSILRVNTGVDFSNYKPNTVKRRILRRMLLSRVSEIQNYLSIVRSDGGEAQSLYEDILINVTEFFRDPEVFSTLSTSIFPRLLNAKKGSDGQIRIWVPGCSTGEEVYSLAISVLEFLGDQADETSIQIFATDVSESALEKARSGFYTSSIAQNVSPERLRRFFIKSDSGFQVHKRVRERCIFARHNLTKDPPFSKLDLISCRNVLIYLGPVLQDRVIPTFHYALKPEGFLLLGSSETVGGHPGMFELMDKKHKIYQRKHTSPRMSLDLAVDQTAAENPERRRKPEHISEYDLQREADRVVLNKYGPPGAVVDEHMDIVQFRGQMSGLIEPAAGTASLNLLRMLKEGLAVEVKNAIAKARHENGPVRREGVFVNENGGKLVNVEVIPFRRISGRDRKYLVLFEASPEKPEAVIPTGKRKSPREERMRDENELLRQELGTTREYLQSIIEDQEAAHEELQSASEEIQSSNEELQSTNEELETAKEELQSTNEELSTVNDELQNRNMQLAQVGNDLSNLLANVNMPILILGNDLRIRRFTPVAEKALNLIPSDVGRPIRDINLRIPVPNLESILVDVTDNLTPRVLEVTDSDGRAFSLRVRPYRTEDNKINGVVMVFIDVDPVMRAAESNIALPAAGESAVSRPAVLLVQEEERRRLAHELHDELNQKLALLEFHVQTLEMSPETDREQRKKPLGELRKSVAGLSDDLRRIAYQLHPAILDDLGLVPALQAYIDEFSARENIPVRLTNQNVPGELPPPVALALYRVVQEGLRNVAKHADARRASVSLTCIGDRLELSVKDTGTGFYVDDTLKPGLGMVGMRERVALVGGTIQWKSRPAEGTQVLVNIPLKPLNRSERAPDAGREAPPTS